jgi:hypothetical protein
MLPLPPKRIPPLGAGKRSARQRILAAWRGVDTAPLEKARTDASKSVGSVLPKILGDIRIDRRQAEAEIVKVWNSLREIDPLLMSYAQPTGLNKGTLFVTVANSAVLSDFKRYHSKKILERLQHSFGKDLVARISFRVG